MAGRILVLDDEENYAVMLQDLLRENNYLVDMATRPERAITQLEEIPYDLVISDYKMPVMDGADFLKKARELYPNLPFILVSGLMNTPELVKVANMSVTLVMEKPLDTGAFLQQVSRFSEPLTDEEKEQLVQEGKSAAAATAALSFPEEPRFFSASNFISHRFLQKAWSIAKEGRELFIHEPRGGDSELALKDLSRWRGNVDMPVEIIQLADSNDEAIGQVRAVLSDFEKSRLIGVRLLSAFDIDRARKLSELVYREVEGSHSALLAYIVSGDSGVKEFVDAVGQDALVLPPLCLRPSDLAVYARRIARVAAERAGSNKGREFTPEAAYALLSYEWPGNYKQIQEVFQVAVPAGKDEPLTLEALKQALGQNLEPVSAGERIAALMKSEQGRYLNFQLEQEGFSVAELGKKLKLATIIQTKDDLHNMPLLRSELGHI